jgi:hypothetical protein
MPLFMRIGRALSVRLTRVTVDPPAFSDLAGAFNANVEKVYARIFTYVDDAIAGER